VARAAARWIAIDVADTGVGIPRAQQSRLFREFSRLHEGDKPGAGLGLAISQRVSRALGGVITLQSEEGQGATFTLWLPVRGEAAGSR
jgi:signal transduction histidine kinase